MVLYKTVDEPNVLCNILVLRTGEATVSTTYMNDYWRVLMLFDALHFRKRSASMLQLEY
jgi:hypothetical protein